MPEESKNNEAPSSPERVSSIEFIPTGGRSVSGPEKARNLRIALVGNPNCGKTTLFNALTGLNFKVGNYPGVTVEQREGSYSYQNRQFTLIDLPGTYSLAAASEDEQIVRDLLYGQLRGVEPPDMIVVVVDGSHLERHLFLATQAIDLGLPVVIALTMNDEAAGKGRAVNSDELSKQLHVPVVEVTVPRNSGVADLRHVIAKSEYNTPPAMVWPLSEPMAEALQAVDQAVAALGKFPERIRRQLALQLLLDETSSHFLADNPVVRIAATAARDELNRVDEHWREADANWRYGLIHKISQLARKQSPGYKPSKSDRVDKVLTHPVFGLAFFCLVMAVVFQSIFSWAGPFMDAIDSLFGWLGGVVGNLLPVGPLKGLLVDGVIAGVGGVLIFLPQILLLFLFIVILEDSGYMARAAFLMNRHMRRAGLHGKAFVPMLSGFACAIPAIMSARTIPDKRDKLVTMLVVPLVSCSARLPVYALVIAAFVPALPVFGNFTGFTFQGLVLVSAYMFSLAAAITCAFLLRRTMFKGESQPFILELPPYRIPHWRTVLITMWERGKLFLTQAGTIILAANVLLWFLLSYPQAPPGSGSFDEMRLDAGTALAGQSLDEHLAEIDKLEASHALTYSFAGRAGRWMEPALTPLGFDWKIGIGLIGSLAAREVFVSTMAVVYGLGEVSETDESMISRLRRDFGLLSGVSIIIFFILACQCMSTLAVVRRETNSWKWPLFMFGYMTVLAYLGSLLFYQVASRIWPELA